MNLVTRQSTYNFYNKAAADYFSSPSVFATEIESTIHLLPKSQIARRGSTARFLSDLVGDPEDRVVFS